MRCVHREAAALGRLGKHEQALHAVESALALDPRDAWALGTNGVLLCEVGEFEAALKPLEEALKVDPQDAWVQGTRGWALITWAEPWGSGGESFDRAHELKPTAISWQLGQADALHLLHDDAAQAAYRTVVDRARTILRPTK